MHRLFNQNLVVENVRKMFASPCSDEKVGPCSDNGDEVCICVCQAITPVVRYCQFFGIAPISLHSSSDHNRNTKINSINFKQGMTHIMSNGGATRFCKSGKKCGMTSRWGSLPSIANATLLFSFASITTWFFFRIRVVLKVYFEGTDLYTFGTQTLCLYTQANLILINSFIQREKFCEIWALLLRVLRDLTPRSCDNLECTLRLDPLITTPIGNESLKTLAMATSDLPNLGKPYPCQTEISFDASLPGQLETQQLCNIKDNSKQNKLKRRLRHIRICSYVSVLTALVLSIGHTFSFIHLVFGSCFDTLVDPTIGTQVSGKPPCPFSDFFLFLQKFVYGAIDFVQQGLALMFGVLCLVIYTFFEEIEDQLERILKAGHDIKSLGVQRHFQVDKLRMIYEDLSRCCRLMSQCFGLSVLAVMITSVVSITCALYSFTLFSGAIAKDESLKIAKFYVIWAFHGWFGCFCLIFILIPGQLISNSSEGPSQVIGRCALVHLDKETKYQLSQFQHQCREKVVITAWNVTNVGVGFIAAAATNVTTYILVILQFRLGVEK